MRLSRGYLRNDPFFRAVDRKTRTLGLGRLDRQRAWTMVKRRALRAGIDTEGICKHTFLVTALPSHEDGLAPLERVAERRRQRGHRPAAAPESSEPRATE